MVIMEISPDICFGIISITNKFIDHSIRDHIRKASWLGTSVFEYTHHYFQKQLWKQISNMPNTNNPRIIIDDLNK